VDAPVSVDPDRRSFLSTASSVAMAGGLAAGYGTFAYMAGRFLYPSEGRKLAWVFVAEVGRLKEGDSLRYETPAGQTVTVTRRSAGGAVEDFLALSSTCPHLGCKVHWEAVNNRFFCPCHNGAFDPSGKAVAGPPAEAGQSLSQYPLKVENGLLFMEVPVDTI
jgi:cytochrome b6-f complex iron-sulfur subunit